jgi:hypothetical protein
MAKIEVVREGFLTSGTGRQPKKDPPDFHWPATKRVTADVKEKFRAKLIEELRARGMDHRDLAIAAHGQVKHKNGRTVPRAPGQARGWVFGKSFPTAKAAAGIAGYFKLSMAQLLQPKGELKPMELLRVGPRTKTKKANGHDHGAAAVEQTGAIRMLHEEPPPLPLPEGAKAPTVKLESLPGDPRFMSIEISGVMLVDRALALVAMIHPEHR